jgi:hypothetical protein
MLVSTRADQERAGGIEKGGTTVKIVLLMSVLFQFIPSTSALAEAQLVQRVSFVDEGSVPPASRLYSCVRSLQGQVFDELKTKQCLSDLLASRFFKGGDFSIKDWGTGGLELIFHLKSPSLAVTALNFELPQQERNELESWLAADTRNLRVGSNYNSDAEATTFYGIQAFFRSRGEAVLFHSTVSLNYTRGDAQVTYKFVTGPKGPEESILPPYVPACPHYIKLLDLTGVDDNIPFSLIDQIMRVRAFSCFDPELLKQDEKHLLASGIVKEAHLSSGKDGQDWEVRLTARRGNQFILRSMDVKGFGKAVNLSDAQMQTLPFQVGQPYKNSLANKTADSLEKMFSDSEHKISIIQRASLVDKKNLHIEFDVLVVPQDELFIDGERY